MRTMWRRAAAAGLAAAFLYAVPTFAASLPATGAPPIGANPMSPMGQYNSVPPTLSAGASSYLQLDASGNLKTTSSGTVAPGPYVYTPLGCQALPSMATATGFTLVPTGATLVDIQVAAQNVNYRDDGTAPTASIGLTIYAGAPWLAYSGSLTAIQFIQVSATATGFACFYK